MSDYSEFFLKCPSKVVQLETLQISHSDFSQTYWIVRNKTTGLTATLETAAVINFQYYPLLIENAGMRDNLDQIIRVTLGDLGEILPMELDNVATNDGFLERPVVTYRTYRSDVLTAPLVGPIVLEVETFAFTKEGCTFEAKAPSLNVKKTGNLYKIDRFPMLRGFI